MRKKQEHDFAVTAFRVAQEATGQLKGGFDAKALGRLGGLKGGKVRADRLTPERRIEIAKKAALARWGNNHEFSPQLTLHLLGD